MPINLGRLYPISDFYVDKNIPPDFENDPKWNRIANYCLHIPIISLNPIRVYRLDNRLYTLSKTGLLLALIKNNIKVIHITPLKIDDVRFQNKQFKISDIMTNFVPILEYFAIYY